MVSNSSSTVRNICIFIRLRPPSSCMTESTRGSSMVVETRSENVKRGPSDRFLSRRTRFPRSGRVRANKNLVGRH